MKLTVDGYIYQVQRFGGISRIFSEILPRMCDLNEQLRIEIFTIGKPVSPVPSHRRIRLRKIPKMENLFRPNRLFSPLLPGLGRKIKQKWMGEGKGRIWHSTYFTVPERWGGKQVVTVHDMIHERFSQIYKTSYFDHDRQMKAKCLEMADAVICVSKSTREDLLSYFDLQHAHIYVVHQAASNIFRRLSSDVENSNQILQKPFILYVGMRFFHKNFDLLAQAYSQWRKKKEILLVVVGKPWSDEEKKRLSEMRVLDRIVLLTDIDDRYLCRLYNQAVALVYPSVYEGFGIPVVEAMACGCPIVASRIPSTIEVAGECPVYFDLKDADDLILALEAILDDGPENKRRQNGIKRAALYSWDKTAAQTLNVYQSLSAQEDN